MNLPAYTVTRKPVKYTRIKVLPPDGRVVVSAPRHVSEGDIATFVREKSAWIAKTQARVVDLPPRLEAGPEAERMRARLRELAPPLVAYWSERMFEEPPMVRYRLMHTRWGSCNAVKRRINLSVALGGLDEELIEYVVVHELVHLSVSNHGPLFREAMDCYLPGWRAKRKRLNRR